jgi:hypothetical protein
LAATAAEKEKQMDYLERTLDKTLEELAQDMLDHFEQRPRADEDTYLSNVN